MTTKSMRVEGINKKDFKRRITLKTMCAIQYNGWPCATCFYHLDSKHLSNKDWQSLLLYRGDSTREELNNLPKSPEDSIKKIWRLLQ